MPPCLPASAARANDLVHSVHRSVGNVRHVRPSTGPRRGSVHGVRSGLMNDETLEIRLLETAEQMAPIVTMFQQVWGSVIPLVGVELLRAIGHAGGYVAGAFDSDHIVGASFGFLARFEGEEALHSHVTGILPGVQRSGVGRAMKNHQRSWAAEQGLKWVTWTFDPLVRRNAWFNIEVLRAHVAEYLVDFYGPMTDSINAHDESDRLLVAWPTDPTATVDEPVHDPQAIEVRHARGHRRDPAHRSRRGTRLAPARPRRSSANGCTAVPSSSGFTRAGAYIVYAGERASRT